MRWLSALTIICYAGLSNSYLLPRTIFPSHYDIFLTFDMDSAHSFPFFGVAKILIKTNQETNKIVLHAQDYTIDSDRVTITNSEGTDYPVSSVSLNDTFNFMTICCKEVLEANQSYSLVIPFSGHLKDDLDGIYTSNYVNKKTKAKEYLIASQFEAISARKGFPCFDEPIFKATFKINIGHDKSFSAISNMPLMNSTNENPMEEFWPWNEINEKFMISKSDMVWDQFEVSVPMSTYLVAVAVSKFAFVESPSVLTKAKFKIWARSDALSQTQYASKIGPEILSFYENWFNVSFPLPKVDMIAIPDFSAGAMENWGLITYRETALLYDNEQSSMLNKERVAEVVAHELAHQWFGNLVTMKWWSDLWLNEGFATHVASIGMNAVEPGWKVYETEAVDQIQTVWNKDKMATSHPVSVPLDNPKRISEIFDEISYRKGSVLIRMMTKFLGEDVFRKAINKYLVKYSYSNAEQDDLWTELTVVSQQYGVMVRNVSIKQVMDTWTKQTGYPLITVNRNYNDKTLKIKQIRYLALGSTSPQNSSWWVPLRVLCQSDSSAELQRPLEWLAEDEGVTSEQEFNHNSKPDEWVLFNADLIAPYRLNYDKKNWDLLIKTLNSDKFTTIPTLSRVQLLADSFELASNNIIHYSTAMELANYLHQETEYSPLQTGLSVLSGIGSILARSPEYGAYQKFIRKLITPAYERYGGIVSKRNTDPDDILSVKMQVILSEDACHAEVPGCQENAIELFQRWMDSDTPNEDNPIPLDVRFTVYCVAISRGSVAQWRFLLKREQEANVASQRTTMLRALACSRDVWLLNQYLEWSIGGVEVRSQDAGMVISAITRSPVGFFLAKNFLYNRIDEIFKNFKSQSRRLGHLFRVLLAQFTTQREIDEFIEWRKCNSKYLEDSKLAIDQAIEKANINVAWIAKNKDTVVKLLRKFAGSE